MAGYYYEIKRTRYLLFKYRVVVFERNIVGGGWQAQQLTLTLKGARKWARDYIERWTHIEPVVESTQ